MRSGFSLAELLHDASQELELEAEKAGTTVSGEDSSTGLGLAIVKRILDLHGSRITVTSSVNESTRFEFDLPIPAAA